MKFGIDGMSDDEIAQLAGYPTDKLQSEVEQVITSTLEIFEAHFSTKFKRPSVAYDLKGHTAGYANSKRIRLNIELLYSHHDDMMKQTIPHEVAHVVQRQLYPHSKSHGYEWYNLMRILGIPPRRTHEYKTTPARVRKREFVYYCNCEAPHKVTKTLHNRIQQGKVYICQKCRTQLRERR